MNRRNFLQSSLALAGGGTVAASLPAAAESRDSSPRQFYELRYYHLKRDQTELFDKFCRDAAIPALNRAGVPQVGVFAERQPAEEPTMYVVLVHPSLESVTATAARLDADEEFQKAGADFLNVPATSPSFIRIDSALSLAFEGMPKLEAPAFSNGGKTRVVQLRIYESPSQKAHLKKVEMFNRWEMAIFRRVGLTPVFFGQTLVGGRLPNLTYMLGFENAEAQDKAWKAFGGDAEWKKLKATPGYTDPEIVSKITNLLLQPTPYSQI